jgi:hypothetical protein
MTSRMRRIFILALLSVAALSASAADTIRIRIENKYVARINLGFLGKGERSGTDILDGTLTLQPDGTTWKGEVDANIDMTQELKGLGRECPKTQFTGSQRLLMRAKKAIDGFSSGSYSITNRRGTAGAGQLIIDVEPKEAPDINPTGPCLDMYQNGPVPLLPLNDARWTQQPGYVIELPRSGVLEYEDQPHLDSTLGESHWVIRVERL